MKATRGVRTDSSSARRERERESAVTLRRTRVDWRRIGSPRSSRSRRGHGKSLSRLRTSSLTRNRSGLTTRSRMYVSNGSARTISIENAGERETPRERLYFRLYYDRRRGIFSRLVLFRWNSSRTMKRFERETRISCHSERVRKSFRFTV